MALSAGVDAFGPPMPSWLTNLMNMMQNYRPGNSASPFGGQPPFAIPSQPAAKPSTSTSTSTSSTGAPNPFAAFSRTQVGAPFGTFAPDSGKIPTAPAFKSQSTVVVASSSSASRPATTLAPVTNGTIANSTSTSSSIIATPSANSSIISCAADAKANPNAAHDATHRCNWLPGFDINTNTEQSWPNTGNTVKYTLTITNGTIAPQGDNKIGFLINGQYPGPKITANWGDYVEVTVVNKLQNNGTSIHFHGLTQKGFNDADGVGGITQCPLAPGQSATYRWQATQYGTAWYHSHFTGQYGDGVLGPIIINGPTSLNYDIDLGEMMISDYFPLTAFQTYYIATRQGPQTATNYLINGKNAKVDGSGGQRTSFTFTPGKRHKFHVINTSVDAHLKVQIDGHTLIVVAMDLNPIQPYRTTELSVSVGQRYDIIVEANATPGNYWLRAMFGASCAKGLNTGTGDIANGIITYSNAPNALPTSQMAIAHSDDCYDEPASSLIPIVPLPVDSLAFASASTSLAIQGQRLTSASDTVFTWTLGGISEVVDWSNPTLGLSVGGVTTFDTQKHVVTLNNPNAWVYWVYQNSLEMPHPLHVHGHDFRLLGSGNGAFDAGSMTSLLNFANPPRRDTIQIARSGWVVAAFKTDNPGAWAMHCHMAWHASGGFALQYLERPSEIAGIYGSVVNGDQYKNTCSTWKTYYASSIYKQDDSGLKRRSVDASDRHAAHLRRHARSFDARATL